MIVRVALFLLLSMALLFFALFYYPDLMRFSGYSGKINTKGVYVKQAGEGFALYKDGEPLNIQGAGGYTNFGMLSRAGANSVRIWDTTGLQTILDSAYFHKLTVAVGLDVGNVNNGFDYTDRRAVEEQFQRIKNTVEKHKDHPAILMWVIGNELYSWRSWRAVNDIAAMIHELDPQHPTTTTMINFQPKNCMLIKWFCPEIDILSINTFGALPFLPEEISHWLWGWRGPYIVMEWGGSGKWEVENTSWGAPVEHTSTKKAEIILDRFKRFQEQNDQQCLGTYAFYWGQKNEATPTWFSLFTPHGHPTEPIAALSQIWQGRLQDESFPRLNYILINKKGSLDNITLQAGKKYESTVVLHDSSSTGMAFQYKIYTETVFPGHEEGDSLDYIPVYQTPFLEGKDQVIIPAPEKEGAYRLYVYVKDTSNRVATSNIPFFVFE